LKKEKGEKKGNDEEVATIEEKKERNMKNN
jgi:hypothetical protein